MPVWLTAKVLVYGFLILSLMGMIGTGVYKVKQWGYNEAKAECLAAAAKQRKTEEDKIGKAAIGLEKDRTKTKIIYRTIEKQVATYIDRPIYRSDCFDADGLRDANAALRGESTAGPKPH